MIMKINVPKGLLHQYIAALAACFSLVTSGSCYGWITPLLSHLLGPDSNIPITSSEAPWIVAIIELGNLLSPMPAGLISDYIGRKPVLLATGPLYIISWLMILYFPTALMLGITRVIQGISMGLAFTAAPIYLGEIASNSTRGAVTSIFFNSWWIGFLISYAVGPYLDYKNFTYFTLALNVPFLLFFFWQPESPYYYLLTGNEEKAIQSLEWFRDLPSDKLQEELEELKLSVEETKKSVGLKGIVATKVDRRALYLLMVLTAVRIVSGTGSLLVYATEIFDLTPNLSLSPDTITTAFGVVMLLGGIINSFTSDSLGRRPLLIISCVGSLFCQFFTGTYYYLLFNTDIMVSQFSWIAPILILVYSGLCTAGMYPVCASYTSELFSTNTRGTASSLGAMNVTAFSFLALISYQPITDCLGLYANFYMYSIFLLFGSLYFYFYAPETKNKSFAQIRKEMSEMGVLRL